MAVILGIFGTIQYRSKYLILVGAVQLGGEPGSGRARGVLAVPRSTVP